MTLSHPSALLIVEQNETVPSLPRYNSYTPGWGKRGAYRWLHWTYSISTRRNSGCLVRAGLGSLSSVKWVSFPRDCEVFLSYFLVFSSWTPELWHHWPKCSPEISVSLSCSLHSKIEGWPGLLLERQTEIVSRCLSTVTNVKQYNHSLFR